MKKTVIFILLFALVASSAFSQRRRTSAIKWLSIELKGGYGGSMLLNSDVKSDQNAELAISTPAYEFGGRLGFTYGDHIGVGIEYLKSGFNQDYNIKSSNLDAYTKTQKFNTSDIVLSFRYTSLYGFYFEVGPKFSNIQDVKVENSITNQSFTDINGGDYAQHFYDKFTSIIFGLGYAAYNGDRLRVNLGLRASYGLASVVEDSNFYVLNDGYYIPQGSFTSNTNPFNIKLTLGINYTFGFWGNASCGRGRLIFFQ